MDKYSCPESQMQICAYRECTVGSSKRRRLARIFGRQVGRSAFQDHFLNRGRQVTRFEPTVLNSGQLVSPRTNPQHTSRRYRGRWRPLTTYQFLRRQFSKFYYAVKFSLHAPTAGFKAERDFRKGAQSRY